MRFSIILASRERVKLLRGLLDSLIKSTAQPQDIEVLVIFDNDDQLSLPNIPKLEEEYATINVKIFTRERSEWMHRDYINWICPKTQGKYVLVLNDDTRFVNPNWDLLAWAKLEEYLSDKPDGIVYGFTDTFSKDAKLCCFPLISKRAIEVLGFMMPNERKNWAADHDMYSIYTHPLVNRKLNLPEIKIEHVAYHAGMRERDAISYRIEQIFTKEPYVEVPFAKYADCLASHISKSSVVMDNKVLVVYNICGISRRENVDYYLPAIYSLINQKFSGFRVVISGCLTQDDTKRFLTENLGNRVSYNWIDEKLPLNVTFNHTVRKCVKEFGNFENYLYVDSGVTFGNNRQVIQKMYDRMDRYAMVATRVDIDAGYEYWGIDIKDEDYIMPVGKACNLHCQMFAHQIYENYGERILPDIFASHTSESVYTFMNAAIKRKWAVCHDLLLHHESNMDGASSGFLNQSLLFRSPKTIEQICAQGKPFGFGYEEFKRVCVHLPNKFDKDGFALDSGLYPFCRDNLFLSKSSFDYDLVQSHFVNDSQGKKDVLPSPHITCIICSHNKPKQVNDAIRSVLTQDYDDWQAILFDSGVLYDKGHFDWLEDDRFIIVRSNETNDTRLTKAMAPWCFNECFRRGLVKGALVVYLCDDDIFYPNAFGVFVEHKCNNMHMHAMYASQDCAVMDSEGITVVVKERRAQEICGRSVHGAQLDCRVDYLQFCHTLGVLDWLNTTDYWPEGKNTESHADGVFMENVGKVVPIYPIDIKIGQNRRTPLSIYDPAKV